jgi:hypothetical protein
VLQAVFWYRYFAGIRFTWRSVFPVGITNLAGTPFFRKRGAGCIKKGAGAPFFLKKGAPAPFLREKGVPYIQDPTTYCIVAHFPVPYIHDPNVQ